MKKTIIQCVTAVLCVIAVAVTSSTAVGKMAEAQVKAAEAQAKNASVVVNTNGGSDDSGTTTDTPAADDNTTTDTPAADDNTTTDTPAADDNTTTGGDNGTTTGGKTDKPVTGSTAPTSKSDIIKYYNAAINKAVSSKAGYTKKRNTTLGELEGAGPIMKFDVAKNAVYDFLGVGDKNYTNKKGEAKYLSQASLTDADVKEAKCSVSGSVYTITLTLADGKSVANDSQKVDNAALKRSGLVVGNEDKTEYDYKSAVNIYNGLKNTEETDITSVDETTSKTTITIKVDSKTGNIQSFDAAWHWDATLTGVKYLVVKINGVGHADSKVSIPSFQF